MNILHPLYREIHKSESLKSTALFMYLKDHPGYLGQVKSTRFIWQEVIEVPNASGYPEKQISYPNQNTSALAFDYDKLGIDLIKNKSSNTLFSSSQELNPINYQ